MIKFKSFQSNKQVNWEEERTKMASEIRGTVGSLQSLPNVIYQSKVSAPKNPKLIRELKKIRKVIISSLLKPQQQQQQKKKI